MLKRLLTLSAFALLTSCAHGENSTAPEKSTTPAMVAATPAPPATPVATPAPIAATPAAPTATPYVDTAGHELGRWELYFYNRVQKFKAENATLPKDRKNVVFLGDSLTEGFPTKTYFPTQPVLNRGIVSDGANNLPGDQFKYRGILNRMDECVYDCNPALVILLIGTNDVGQGPGLKYWIDSEREIVDKIQARFPDAKIVLETLPPTGAAYKKNAFLNPRIIEYNGMIKELAKEKNLPVVDVYNLYVGSDGLLPADLTGDGLHVKKAAYDRWAEALRPHIEALHLPAVEDAPKS
ncbi:hypothetical protein BH09SUM1_BH09SUM1_22540 [soil metagenome]